MKKLYKGIRQILEYVGRRNVATIASSSAFWFFLSLVPIAILLSTLLPYTSITQDALLKALQPLVPDSMSELLETILHDVYQSNLAVLSVSLLATVWAAARGFSALIRGLEEVYGRDHRSGYLHRRIWGIVYTLLFMGALLLSILIMGLGRWLLELIEKGWPPSRRIVSFLLPLRFLPMVAVLTLAFTAIYTFGPGMKLPYFQQMPGGFFSAVSWSIFSGAFSFIVSLTGGYGTYGSLATVVAVMLWLYYCMYILLLGACLNRAAAHLKGWDIPRPVS